MAQNTQRKRGEVARHIRVSLTHKDAEQLDEMLALTERLNKPLNQSMIVSKAIALLHTHATDPTSPHAAYWLFKA